jgi:predicted amino acid racemase
MYPRVIINKEKFRHNLRHMLDICHEKGLSMMAVSKVFCADHELVEIMIEENVDFIADSRIENLIGIASVIPKVLLRLPSIGDAKRIVMHSDISLNSEIATIKALDKYAQELNKIHGVILMIDLGDLREGIFEKKELIETIKRVLRLKNISLKGIGTNLTCYGGIIPTEEILQKLVEYKDMIESEFDIILDIISGGNSSNIELLVDNKIPVGINNIRLGESIILGRETAYGNYLDNTYADVITLEAEIIELKEKPSIPIGTIGMNAFGKIPIFEDKGNILRAILAIGKQDVDYTELIPYDTVSLIGSSSDHIIVDISDCYNIYEVGDTMLFKLTYASILSLMTSKYVVKTYE